MGEPLAMNPEIRAQWVRALRSGDYVQGRGGLQRSDGTFCCLGVLCDLAVKAGEIRPPELSTSGGWWSYGEGEVGYLPAAVEEWAGLNSHCPVVRKGSYRVTLTSLNDGSGDSRATAFSDIADLIEGVSA